MVKKDRTCKIWINASLFEAILPYTVGSTTARTLWLNLENRFGGISRSHLLQLKASEQLDDLDFVAYTLNSLPSDCNAFATLIRVRSDPGFQDFPPPSKLTTPSPKYYQHQLPSLSASYSFTNQASPSTYTYHPSRSGTHPIQRPGFQLQGAQEIRHLTKISHRCRHQLSHLVSPFVSMLHLHDSPESHESILLALLNLAIKDETSIINRLIDCNIAVQLAVAITLKVAIREMYGGDREEVLIQGEQVPEKYIHKVEDGGIQVPDASAAQLMDVPVIDLALLAASSISADELEKLRSALATNQSSDQISFCNKTEYQGEQKEPQPVKRLV
ncbi:hypothetical protein ACFX14_023126 [Malus domestica]